MDDETIYLLHRTLSALQRVERCEEHYTPADVRDEVTTNLIADDKGVPALDDAVEAASNLLTVLRDAQRAAQQAANTPDCEECGAVRQGDEWDLTDRRLCYDCVQELGRDWRVPHHWHIEGA